MTALAPQSLGHRLFIAASKGDHFNVGKHAVLDVNRRDVAAVVGVDEEHAGAVSENLAVLFAGSAVLLTASCEFRGGHRRSTVINGEILYVPRDVQI